MLTVCTSCGAWGSRLDGADPRWVVSVDCYRCPDGYTIRESG